MTDFETRTVLKAFLASPGDLDDERRIARAVVDEVNHTVGRTWGITVELLGWEDTLPGAGRPQALINHDVDSCDLFIGMLWRRWGQPTGTHSSGFEEEFERARSRRRATMKPELWLAFKAVDPDNLRDPGDQLKKVIAFQEAQRAARELLYKEFSDTEDWTKKLREWLLIHVCEVARSQLQAQAPAPSAALPTPPSTGATSLGTEGDSEPLPAKIRSLGTKVSHALSRGSIDDYLAAFVELDRDELVGLHLLSKAMVSALFTNELLSVHDTNLVFKERRTLVLVPPEETLLFHTVISDDDGVLPGWFWFSHSTAPEMADRILRTAHDGTIEEGVRSRAMSLLTFGRIAPQTEKQRGMWRDLFQSSTDTLAVAALDAAATLGGADVLSALDAIVISRPGVVARKAAAVRIKILARLDPTKGLEKAAEDGGLTKDALDALEDSLGTVPKPALEAAIGSPDPRVRAIAARQLLVRHAIDDESAKRLLTDRNMAVRAVALRALIELGAPLTSKEIFDQLKTEQPKQTGILPLMTPHQDVVDPEPIVLQLYRNFTLDQLEAQISWFGLDSALAYQALALGFFSQRGDQIRQDLREGFSRIKQTYVDDMRARLGDAAEPILQQWTNVEDFVRSQFAAAALSGIAAHGRPEDIDLARPFLANPRRPNIVDEQTTHAIDIVRQFGNADDVPGLIDLAVAAYSPGKLAAARAALDLSPDPVATGRILLETGDAQLSGVTVDALWSTSPTTLGDVLYPYLSSKSVDTRVRVLTYFAYQKTRQELEELLEKYLSQDAYYYNVVCWLDRVLYAPEPLREAYKALLKKELTVQ